MLSIRNFYYFPDTSDALKQMESAFGDAAAKVEGQAAFSLIGVLVVSVRLNGPFAGRQQPRRGSYHKPTATYYAEAFADYERWIRPEWQVRTQNYADALKAAIGRVAKTRLPEPERAMLLARIDRLAESVAAVPPGDVKPLKPVKLIYTGDSLRPMIAFDAGHAATDAAWAGSRIVIVSPEEAQAVADGLPEPAPERPESFKTYKREDDILAYHEAWANDGEITEHWGICGTEGDQSTHVYDSLAAGQNIIQAIKKRAREAGFSALARSKHRQLVIELSVDGFGTADELDLRHKLEAYFDNRLGWLGLGHVDGGSTGSGSMEIFCIVPDFVVAKAAVEKELVELEIEDARLYEMK